MPDVRFRPILLIIMLSVASTLLGADTSTRTLHPAFRTLQIAPESNPYAPPVIILGSDDRITMEFDELASVPRYLRYQLLHCDAHWQPDRLIDNEYLTGFNEQPVTDYAYSRATLTHYVHYRITLPDGGMAPTVSGNYLIRVYDESNPDSTLLQARFAVCEPMVSIDASVSGRTDMDTNTSHQQLTIDIDPIHLNIADPVSELSVVVTRNNRSDDEVILPAPSSFSNRRITYAHLPQLIFPGGNEYRRFETVSTSYPGRGVEEISFDGFRYTHSLITDHPRNVDRYTYDQTQAGRFTIRNSDAADSSIEAEYTYVTFTLAGPRLPGLDVYIDGDFTGRKFDPDSRMSYDPVSQCYEKTLLLKQGSYNYQYLTLPSGVSRHRASTATIEGDFYQTVNEYLIMVYHMPPGARYQRLVGTTVIYSDK